jgi:hypothetical protein
MQARQAWEGYSDVNPPRLARFRFEAPMSLRKRLDRLFVLAPSFP